MKRKRKYLGVVIVAFIFCILAMIYQISDRSDATADNASTKMAIHKQALDAENFSREDSKNQLIEPNTHHVEDMAQIIEQIDYSPYYKYRYYTFLEASTVVIQLDLYRNDSTYDLDKATSTSILTTKRDDIDMFRRDAKLIFSSMEYVKKITFNIGVFINLTFTREWAEHVVDEKLTADNSTENMRTEGTPLEALLSEDGKPTQDTLTVDAFESDTLLYQGNGPLIGFISDEQSDFFDVYAKENATYVTSLPMSLFSSLYKENKSGWIEDADVYYGITDDFSWGVIATASNLGMGNVNVCTSLNRGESWWIGEPDSMISGTVTGAGFASKDIGFLSYRYFRDKGPEIARTLDGGKTWSPMKVEVPSRPENERFTPLNPIFKGLKGIYPIMESFNSKLLYLITEDGGLTWCWQKDNLEE
ncbi:beta propeller repeat protein [Fusibacter ferrireducens]|uniref:Uncharacterized protein n=1 Tax=Fusibacter ferrireducens TaxID=2785058 RepID=A0ABR9ZVB3_9FIRM|nr:hypothetical protein [Fusibacter ferrireducens]MBF4693931.1 hypothetical protein [Fusibacter ferrireducens]